MTGCTRAPASGSALLPAAPGGSDLYAGLDDRDRDFASAGVQQALESARTGATLRWINEGSGNSGAITPLATFRTTTGYYCRRYREKVFHNQQNEASAVFTACRDDTGVWQQVEF